MRKDKIFMMKNQVNVDEIFIIMKLQSKINGVRDILKEILFAIEILSRNRQKADIVCRLHIRPRQFRHKLFEMVATAWILDLLNILDNFAF